METKYLFLVEDHEIMRNTLVSMLEKEKDFAICGKADSGENALALLENLSPDLVLIDISLPKMSGLTLLEEIKQQWPDLPCMILSGHSASIYQERAMEGGALAYVEKNQVREFVPTIRKILNSV